MTALLDTSFLLATAFELDYADLAQVAVAERLGIKRIYTFDRRDFGIIRPIHTDYFELLP